MLIETLLYPKDPLTPPPPKQKNFLSSFLLYAFDSNLQTVQVVLQQAHAFIILFLKKKFKSDCSIKTK